METKLWGKPILSPKTFEARDFKQVRHLKTLGVCTNVQVKQTLVVPASDKEIETSF